VKRLQLRRGDTCRGCGVALAARVEAWWDPAEREVRCLACVGSSAGAPAAQFESVPTVGTAPEAEVEAEAGGDVAGGSARREYERRSARQRERHERAVAEDVAWRAATIERRPVLGRIATAVTPRPVAEPEPQSTKAWKVGAEGEERVAEVLRGIAGIEVLHDRRVPGSRANIDHLVVGSAGVFVVDAKKYKAGSAVEVRNRGGLLRPDWRLYVGGRDQTKLVEGVRRQVEVVRRALGPELADVPVRSVLCFVGATWGVVRKPRIVSGVTAVGPLGLPKLVAERGPHAADDVTQIADHLRRALRAAAG
jgi:hypothetical protein